MTASFQKHAEKLVPIIQDAGAAALIAGDSRVVGRAKADGLHLTGPASEICGGDRQAIADKLIVGGGNAADRHHALEIGEQRPDYIFFGKLDGDIKPEAHPKKPGARRVVGLDDRDPCIVMGGTDPASALAVAESGAELVALRLAVFADAGQAPAVVAADQRAAWTKKRHGLRIDIALMPIPTRFRCAFLPPA